MMRHPGAFGPSWMEINGSDQNRAVPLEMTSQYLFSGYSLNCLPVFLKSTLQVPWMEATTGLGQVLKRCTGHGASDSAVLMASIESHCLGEGGPKEIIFEFNQLPTPTVVEAIWDNPPFSASILPSVSLPAYRPSPLP